jgi:hypothetical protein
LYLTTHPDENDNSARPIVHRYRAGIVPN